MGSEMPWRCQQTTHSMFCLILWSTLRKMFTKFKTSKYSKGFYSDSKHTNICAG